MGESQNSNFNTLGFVTSELRRSFVIGVIAIMLLGWGYTFSYMRKENEALEQRNVILENKIEVMNQNRILELQEQLKERDLMISRIKENEIKNANLSNEINRIK